MNARVSPYRVELWEFTKKIRSDVTDPRGAVAMLSGDRGFAAGPVSKFSQVDKVAGRPGRSATFVFQLDRTLRSALRQSTG